MTEIQNIHPHRMPDGTMAFTFQMVHNGKIEPFVHELDLTEATYLVLQLTRMIYEEVSK